jgi:hypothetical protein
MAGTKNPAQGRVFSFLVAGARFGEIPYLIARRVSLMA